ncbi:amino acid-binding protein [Enemella dayhoffiae]|uniref:Amino acid-binding protein n=1 Tax=Enemella dayhoffiae TaxID=2016507 RepID=A0A255GUU2_9ACTN|nr:ACT domain-containing protein [Enemella dayhoffiae]OYO19448.1 amino acid-binding protein [Enemella dayhoffiae]
MIRLLLPDRPGSLGAVATALGTMGADIQAVEIVGREGATVVDDFMVLLPDNVMPDNAVSACTQVDGVQVLWCSRYPAGAGLQSDVEALEKMLADPDNAAAILAESAPVAFHCHWAVLLHRGHGTVLHATPMAPDLTPDSIGRFAPTDTAHSGELPAGWMPEWVETAYAITPLRGERAVVLGRHGGPSFLTAELARLRHLAAMVPLT